jgi:hypothetical protein
MGLGTQSLGQLIEWLKAQPPERVVKYGFGSGHSDRGDYSDVAFDPVKETTIGEMLKHAEEILDTTQYGWKGGAFVMNEYVSAHIGEHGDCGEPITRFNYRAWGDENG